MFTVSFNTNNAHFDDSIGLGIARCLRKAAAEVDFYHARTGSILDDNGNQIGWYRYEPNMDTAMQGD